MGSHKVPFSSPEFARAFPMCIHQTGAEPDAENSTSIEHVPETGGGTGTEIGTGTETRTEMETGTKTLNTKRPRPNPKT